MRSALFKLPSTIITSGILFFAISAVIAQSLTPSQNAEIMSAAQGGIVNLENFLSADLPQIDYRKIVMPGPQYIISDDPEYIRVPEALVVKERVLPGAVRLYLYNVNGVENPGKTDTKITVVLKNTGRENMYVRMLKYSSQPPSTNYYGIAKHGLADYFSSHGLAIPSLAINEPVIIGDEKKPEIQPMTRSIEPDGVIAIDEQLEKNIVKYNELAHGIYEFVIDQPGEVSVIQTDPGSSESDALSRLGSVFPSSNVNAGRGMFGVSNYLIITDTITADAETMALVVADGRQDPWVLGRDSGTGQIIRLAGNYGVMYQIEIPWRSVKRKGLALVTWNPHAGKQYCGGMANVMVVSEGKFPGGIIPLPSDRLITKGAPEAVLVQVFIPSAENEVQYIKLTYTPPGASCLPTPLVFIPVDVDWK